MSTNAPQFTDPGDHDHRRPFTASPFPAPPPKQMGTVRLEVAGLPEVKDAMSNASERIRELEAENKKLRTENQTLQEALAHWQGVVRAAREKDSTLPDPESPSVP